MLTTGFNIEQRIVDLARLDIDGQLAEVLQQYSLECRGLPSDAGQLHTANELIHCKVVAKALSLLFDLPEKECVDAVRRILLPHPRRSAALALIDEYCGRAVTQTADVGPPSQRPTTVGPPTLGLIRGKLTEAGRNG